MSTYSRIFLCCDHETKDGLCSFRYECSSYDTKKGARLAAKGFGWTKLWNPFEKKYLDFCPIHTRGKDWLPNPGDIIYVPTRMSIGHGHDDVAGGKATVVEMQRQERGPDGPYHFAKIKEHSRAFNWENGLRENQLKYRHEYGPLGWAKPDPDYNTYE